MMTLISLNVVCYDYVLILILDSIPEVEELDASFYELAAQIQDLFNSVDLE
jgi:hypothetical protein